MGEAAPQRNSYKGVKLTFMMKKSMAISIIPRNFTPHRIIFSITTSMSFLKWHIVSKIKRPLFSGLQKTVKFPHLLRGHFMDTKNLFPVSNISIPYIGGMSR